MYELANSEKVFKRRYRNNVHVQCVFYLWLPHVHACMHACSYPLRILYVRVLKRLNHVSTSHASTNKIHMLNIVFWVCYHGCSNWLPVCQCVYINSFIRPHTRCVREIRITYSCVEASIFVIWNLILAWTLADLCCCTCMLFVPWEMCTETLGCLADVMGSKGVIHIFLYPPW